MPSRFRSLTAQCMCVSCDCAVFVLQGATDPKYRCKHAHYVSNSNGGREDEFLFAAYSAFTVLAVRWLPAAADNPHVIEVEAVLDNYAVPDTVATAHRVVVGLACESPPRLLLFYMASPALICN